MLLTCSLVSAKNCSAQIFVLIFVVKTVQSDGKGAELEAMMEEMNVREQLWKKKATNKIAYTSFEVGDLALFLPTSYGYGLLLMTFRICAFVC